MSEMEFTPERDDDDDDAKPGEAILQNESQEGNKSEPSKPSNPKPQTMLDAMQDYDDHYANYDFFSPQRSVSSKSAQSTEGEQEAEELEVMSAGSTSEPLNSSSKTLTPGKKGHLRKDGKKNEFYDEERHLQNLDDFIYKPKVNGKIMQLDSLELQHSYSYDCVNGLNLCVADKKTLLYHCGHIIHMLNPYTKEMSFRRSSGKDGISFIAKNPVSYEIAVAEKGNFPDIVCYTWPDFCIISVLRGGAKHSFAGLDFSACGELMVSQSSEPDYLLTIWKWKEQQVYLSVKANNQRVYKTAFSPLENSILLCCGLNHLKFWKIETTFTGMKIKGAYGKFGPADICDISTFIINKDNKAFSNCPWGNMFFWDGTTVKFEISRREMQPAHDGIITFFHYDPKENHVFTAGMDGKIRVWDYEKMLNAWPPNNKPFQMQPSFEREIIDADGKTACPVQLLPRVGVEDIHHFFLQDKKGGIWMIDLSLSANADPWSKILETHAGPIVGLATSPVGHYLATLGIDGKLLIHNNEKRKIVFSKTFSLKGTALLWLPLEIDPTASVLILGFADGTIRVIVICIKAKEFNVEEKIMEYIHVIQALKPHKRSISCLVSKTKYGHHHVLSGSVDGNVFIYKVLPYYNFCQLMPLGFVKMPGPVTHIELKRAKNVFIFLVSTSVGTVSEVQVPDKILHDTRERDTYQLKIKYKTTFFRSVKGCILRNLVREGIKKRQDEKLEKRKEELAKLLEANPGFAIDQEAFLADTEKYEDLPAIFVPVGNTRINFAKYVDKYIWISPDGYDGGFFYEYKIGETWPNRVLDIPGTDRTTAIQTCISILNNKYLLMGMSNGCIRLVKAHQSDLANLSDYLEIGMHVTTGHRITHLAVSCDNSVAYSCGTDGGIFSYVFNLPIEQKVEKKKLPGIGQLPTFGISGIINPNEPSLEEHKATLREEKKKLMAETIKMEMKEKINELADKYEELIERNKKLPESKRLSKDTFIINHHVDQAIIEKYNQEIDDFKKKHEFEFQKAKVLRNKMYDACIKPIKSFPIYQFGIRTPVSVCTFREVKLTPEFIEAERRTKGYLDDQARRDRTVAKKLKDLAKKIQKKAKKPKKRGVDMLKVIDKAGQKLFESGKISRANLQLLKRITESRRERRNIHEHISELNELKKKNCKKAYFIPNLGGHPGNAEFKLKLNPDYRTPKEHRLTLYEQYWRVIKTRRNLHEIKLEFNSKLRKLRTDKFNILREFQILKGEIDYMSEECRMDDIILPRTPNFNTELEFPEKLFMNTPPHCILDDPLPPIPQEWEEERKDLYGDHNFHEIFEETENMSKYVTYTWLPGVMSYEDHMSLATIFPVHPWRADLIHRRIMRFRERVNTKSINLMNRIDEYDKALKNLSYERIEYEKHIIKRKLELYYLIQELEITRGFSALEVNVKTKLSDMIKIKHITLLQMSVRRKKINENNSVIEKCLAISNTITNQFLEVVKDNKYVKHLTRVFKKKYKPPKKRNDDDDSTSSSSMEEDFDDDAEGDDLQVTIGGAYLFDEKIRPDDCDHEIFEKMFKFRAERHVEEAKINEARSQNQQCTKDLETLRKKLLMVETILAIFNSQMDSFLKCKQDACNKIWKVVILKPSQIQHYNKYSQIFPPLSQCVLVSANTIRRLINKAELLEKETQMFNKGKEKCKDHIVRLRKDIEYMKSQCHDLKNEKKEEMRKKFGMHINMNHLEEVITNWIILEANQNTTVVDRTRNYLKDSSIKKRQNLLLEVKKRQTNQYHELFSIQEERNKITSCILNMQQTQKELQIRNNLKRLDLESYLKQLEKEVVCQMKYKEYLLNQISALKFKQKPHLLSKTEKTLYPAKETTSSISTETAMRNIISDLVRKAIPSVTGTETPTEEYQQYQEEDLEEAFSEESVTIPESREEELSPSQFAIEIIKDAIRGVLPSKPDIEDSGLTDYLKKEYASVDSNPFLRMLPQSQEDLFQSQGEEDEISLEEAVTSENEEVVEENEGQTFIKESPEQEGEQEEATISTYEPESEMQGSFEQAITPYQVEDENSTAPEQSQSDSEN